MSAAINDESDECLKAWAKVLHPDLLRSNLIAAGLYLTAWETLRDCVVDQLRSFYSCGFDENGATIGTDYTTRVLSRHKSPIQASLQWFQEEGVVDDADLQLVRRLRAHRNDIAHNLPQFIGKPNRDIDVELIGQLFNLIAKIDRWWIRQVEIPTNPDFDDQEVDAIPDDDIQSGRMFFLATLIRVAAGDREEALKMCEEVFAAVDKRKPKQPGR